MDDSDKHNLFKDSSRKHILVITNHGAHAPVIEITTDTGGQCFYVNSFSKALVDLGYKVTILNRGGYKHMVTEQMHKGVVYYDRVWGKKGLNCRLIYLEDGENKFIPKEELKNSNLIKERDFLFEKAKKIGFGLKEIYFINSHYWDSGVLGVLINEKLKKEYKRHVPHIWTPHSLGILKRKIYRNALRSVVKSLNFSYRIKCEENVISHVEGVVSTSNKIDSTLSKYEARVRNHFRLPPGVDVKIFKDRKISQCSQILKVLKEIKGFDKQELVNLFKTHIVFLETSRTAESKQKDLILKSFAKIQNKDKACLILNVDREAKEYPRIKAIYDKLKAKHNIILIEEYLTDEEIAQLFSLANVYVTSSLMEGWGMAVQDAAASRCAIISSKYVPFVTEVLKDNALLVNKNRQRLYAEKMDILIQEPHLRKKLANRAHRIVTTHRSWNVLVENLILEMKGRDILN